jgi:FixJ family two-component response regulator
MAGPLIFGDDRTALPCSEVIMQTLNALAGRPRRTVDLPMSEPAIVHIIDDDELMREALDGLLRSTGFAVRAYASVDAFLAERVPDAPGCLLLDIRLPGISGLDFQSRLAGLGIHLPVILMTGHADVPMSVRGMKAGAVDFLTKPFREQDMLDAIGAALERDKIRRTEAAANSDMREKFATLSPRERQVMALVTVGKMNKQVAGELALSEITVKIYRGGAMRKMGARTLADLVRMAQTLGLSPDKGSSGAGSSNLNH